MKKKSAPKELLISPFKNDIWVIFRSGFYYGSLFANPQMTPSQINKSVNKHVHVKADRTESSPFLLPRLINYTAGMDKRIDLSCKIEDRDLHVSEMGQIIKEMSQNFHRYMFYGFLKGYQLNGGQESKQKCYEYYMSLKYIPDLVFTKNLDEFLMQSFDPFVFD